MNNSGFRLMPPEEIFELTNKILPGKTLNGEHKEDSLALTSAIADFCTKWENAWTTFGDDPAGELTFRDLIIRFLHQIKPFLSKGLIDDSGKTAMETIRTSMFSFQPGNLGWLLDKMKRKRDFRGLKNGFQPPVFEKPVFILSAPRVGSTLLFETLTTFPDIWTIGRESHETIEGIEELHPSRFGYVSNRLTQEHATQHLASELKKRFARQLKDRDGRLFLNLSGKKRPRSVRFLEKTPKNALRVPFLNTVFPGARFIFLYRDPKESISSLMEGWRSRRYVSYRDLPGWPFREWSFLLVPGWTGFAEASIAEIAAFQWMTANNSIMDDLEQIPTDSWLPVSFRDLVEKPGETVKGIATFADLRWDEGIEKKVSQPLPVSTLALTKPAPEKWRMNYEDIMRVLPAVKPVMNRLEALIKERTADE